MIDPDQSQGCGTLAWEGLLLDLDQELLVDWFQDNYKVVQNIEDTSPCRQG